MFSVSKGVRKHKSEKSTTARALWKRLGNCRGTTIFHRVSSESLLPRSEGSGLERAGARGGRGPDSWPGCLPAPEPHCHRSIPPLLLRFPRGRVFHVIFCSSLRGPWVALLPDSGGFPGCKQFSRRLDTCTPPSKTHCDNSRVLR